LASGGGASDPDDAHDELRLYAGGA
jgi:hypothetical protein